MNQKIFNIESTKLFRILFLIVFWGIWFMLPLMLVMNNPEIIDRIKKLLPINFSLILLFFLNTEILIKRVLKKKSIAHYVITLILLMVLFLISHLIFKSFIFNEPLFHRGEFFRTFFPVLTIGAVSTGYGLINYMIDQQKLHEEEDVQRKQAELSFLRSQISPHFIFNALNSIVYLIRTKNNKAEEVTIKLSEIMQYTLYSSKDEKVSLNREIAYLKNYIELQKIRFGEDVDVNVVIEGETSNVQIEPMLIIPFVENAFKHGTGTVLDPYIYINLEVERNKLMLSVKNAYQKNDHHSDQSGIGLKNVTRRLDLLYPGQYSLDIQPKNDEFTVMLIINLI